MKLVLVGKNSSSNHSNNLFKNIKLLLYNHLRLFKIKIFWL